jgi:hypothetical protein
MRTSVALACCGLAVAALVAGVSPGNAQYAAQLYPYCGLSAANGATTCYYRSREECSRSCIANPWYIGADRARAYTQRGRPIDSRYMRP